MKLAYFLAAVLFLAWSSRGLADEKAQPSSVETNTTPAAPEDTAKTPNSPSSLASSAPTLENMDANRDGTVSKDEFIAFHTGRLDSYFNALDKDNSAALTKEELAFVARRTPSISQRPAGVRSTPAPRAPRGGAPSQDPPGGAGSPPIEGKPIGPAK